MKQPKKMKLVVDMGNRHDASGFQLNLNVHPEKHRLVVDRIKPVKGVVVKNTKNNESISKLASNLGSFSKSQKKSPGISILGATNLDFSRVGITSGLSKKKIKGVTL